MSQFHLPYSRPGWALGPIVFELNRAVVQSGYLNNPSGKLLYRDISGSRKQLDTPVRPMQAFKAVTRQG